MNIPIWGIIFIATLLLVLFILSKLKVRDGNFCPDFFTPMLALITVGCFIVFWAGWILAKIIK